VPFFLTGLSVINNINNIKKNLVDEPRTWTNLGAIFLPGLTMPRHENQKIRYENELLKSKEPTPDV
jgi:cell shape-determining protein MreC